jgi:site-specific DNA recombinase
MKSLLATEVQPTFLYGRVSGEDQAESGTIEAQQYFLRNFVALQGMPLLGQYWDDGISGTIPLQERPEGKRLLEAAAMHPGSVVLVNRIDRLGRSLRVILDAVERLEAMGVAIRSGTEPFDTSNPVGRFMLQLMASLAELDRANLLDRLSHGRDRVARSGAWASGSIPFGYDLDADHRLVPSMRLVPEMGITESELAQRIFQRVAEGATVVATCIWLNGLGVRAYRRTVEPKTPKKKPTNKPVTTRTRLGRRFTRSSTNWELARVTRMLKQPVYRGTSCLKSRYGAIESPVPALVTEDLWNRVQQQLTRNRALAKRNANHLYLLRGLISCAGCGWGFAGMMKPGVARQETGYYRCNGQLAAKCTTASERCKAKVIPAGWLEELIWQDCVAFISDPGDTLAKAQAQLRERLGEAARGVVEQQRLQRALADLEGDKDRVLVLYRKGRIPLADAEHQLDAIQSEASELRRELDGIRAQAELASAVEARVAEATIMLGRLRARLDDIQRTNDLAGKRSIIEALVSRVVVTTVGQGRHKQAHLTLSYVFGDPGVVDTTRPGPTRTQRPPTAPDRARQAW